MPCRRIRRPYTGSGAPLPGADPGRFLWVHTVVDQASPERGLPATVRAEVERRRQGLVGRARGRVLDLDDPQDRAVLVTALVPGGHEPACPRYDTILVTAQLAAWPDLHAVLAALAGMLADDGSLWVLEPVNHPGAAGLLASSVGDWLPANRGRHLSRDVVATLRSVGLTVADLDRFTVATWMWPLRRWVEARAVRIPRQSAAPAAEGSS